MQANDAEGRKNDRLKEKERERRKDPTKVSTTIYRKRGFLPELQGRQGKFWPGARNTIRAKARYSKGLFLFFFL